MGKPLTDPKYEKFFNGELSIIYYKKLKYDSVVYRTPDPSQDSKHASVCVFNKTVSNVMPLNYQIFFEECLVAVFMEINK